MKTILLAAIIPVKGLIAFCFIGVCLIFVITYFLINNREKRIKKRDIVVDIDAIVQTLHATGNPTIDTKLAVAEKLGNYVGETLPYVTKEAGVKKLMRGFEKANELLIDLTDVDVELNPMQQKKHNELSRFIHKLSEMIERKKNELRTGVTPTQIGTISSAR